MRGWERSAGADRDGLRLLQRAVDRADCRGLLPFGFGEKPEALLVGGGLPLLAALRLWQKDGCRAFGIIATNGGDHELMDELEVDALCEKLNTGEVY